MSISDSRKPRGRPPTGIGKAIGLRLYPELDASLDAWIAAQPEPKPSRPEAIRSLLDKALAEGAARLPFEAGRFSYANIPPGQFTLGDMTGAFNELVQHLSGGKPEVEQIALSWLARLLTERGYLRTDGQDLKVEVGG